MSLSEQTITLSSKLSLIEVKEILLSNTLLKEGLVVEKTERLFIGQVQDSRFKIIRATPIGSICVVTGQFENNNNSVSITIHTRLHPVYIGLFIGWLVVLTLVILGFAIKNSKLGDTVGPFICLIAGAGALSFSIHLAYTNVRRQVINLIETAIN